MALSSGVRCVLNLTLDTGGRGGRIVVLVGRKREGESAGARGGDVSKGSGDEDRTGGGGERMGFRAGRACAASRRALLDGKARCRLAIGEERCVGEGELDSRRFPRPAGVGCESGITLGGVVQESEAER